MEPSETEFEIVEDLEEEVAGLESEFESVSTSRERHREVEQLLQEIHRQIEFLNKVAEKND